jgi:hypothetical protein
MSGICLAFTVPFRVALSSRYDITSADLASNLWNNNKRSEPDTEFRNHEKRTRQLIHACTHHRRRSLKKYSFILLFTISWCYRFNLYN